MPSRSSGGPSLSHPSILTVFDVGSHDGSPYLASKLSARARSTLVFAKDTSGWKVVYAHFSGGGGIAPERRARVEDVEEVRGQDQRRESVQLERLGQTQVEVPDVRHTVVLDARRGEGVESPVDARPQLEDDRIQIALGAEERARNLEAARQLVERVRIDLKARRQVGNLSPVDQRIPSLSRGILYRARAQEVFVPVVVGDARPGQPMVG